jgi:hypothetical protein
MSKVQFDQKSYDLRLKTKPTGKQAASKKTLKTVCSDLGIEVLQ